MKRQTEKSNEALVILAQRGCEVVREEAMTALLEKNEGALYDRALTSWNSFSCGRADLSLAFDDFLQTARLAMVEAVGKYDPGKGAKFLTFAWKVINSRLNDLVRPAFADEAHFGELVSLTSYNKEKRHLWNEVVPIVTSKLPDTAYWQKAMYDRLYAAIKKLPDRERIYILQKYGFLDSDPLTKKAARRLFAQTESRLESLEQSALEHLRQELEPSFRKVLEYVLDHQDALQREDGLDISFVPSLVIDDLPFTLRRE